jgi:amino acid permease
MYLLESYLRSRTCNQGEVGQQPRAGSGNRNTPRRRATMLWTLAVIMLVLWGLGLVTSYTLGGFIHILLVVAVVVVLVRVIQGRRVLE